ncbi:MAG: TonB-dependent receptor [Gammaproteobacteria bacterium]
MKIMRIGLSVIIVALAALPALAVAANSDGTIAGQAVDRSNTPLAGVTVTVENTENGYTRSITATTDGRFRFARLPIGSYRVSASKSGFDSAELNAVPVTIGASTTIDLVLAGGVIDEIVVTESMMTGIDVASTESALNINFAELQRIPVSRNAAAVALLAPGVTSGVPFGGISFGGSSVGENAVFINGLNVSDVETGVGFSDVPFSMFKEFQVKTGGYSVEFGRTTGGVVNAVLKSGTNDFHFGADVYSTPEAFRADGRDFFDRNGDRIINRTDSELDSTSASFYASGPIIRDKVLFYALYEPRIIDSQSGNTAGTSISRSEDDSAVWGGKLDWFISNNHSLELFGFSDERTDVTARYEGDSLIETQTTDLGGTNWALTYTGYFGDRLVVKALYGQNERNFDARTDTSTECNRVFDGRDGINQHIGCTTQLRNDKRINSRDAARLDMEFALNDRHLLRFGLDHELRSTDMKRASVGPNEAIYTLDTTMPGESVNNVTVPAGVTEYVLERREIRGGVFDATTSAVYVEDVWSITDDITATIGLRWDEFESDDAAGDPFIKVDDMISPRLGIAWDVGGNGTSKLYANAGRYYFPIANGLAAREGGGTIDTRRYFVLEGLDENTTSNGLTNVTPILGDELGTVVEFGSGEGLGDTKNSKVDQDLEASRQDEFILGYERMLTDTWTMGVRGIHRRFNNAIEDMFVDTEVPGCGSLSQWVFGNVGRPLTLDVTCDDLSVQTATVDLGAAQQFGYDLDGDGNPDAIGSDEATRRYNALEFVFNRQWDGVWSTNLSYTLSRSYGNYEGSVNSDTGNDIPGWTESGDNVMFVNSNWGRLPNDQTHTLKGFGSFAITDKLTLGTNVLLASGRPINARGHGNPFNSQTRKEMNYYCVANCIDPEDGVWTSQDREFEYLPKGKFGETPLIFEVDLSMSYTTDFNGYEARFGLDIFNVFDRQEATRYYEIITDGVAGEEPTFLMTRNAQSPRAIRLRASIDF